MYFAVLGVDRTAEIVQYKPSETVHVTKETAKLRINMLNSCQICTYIVYQKVMSQPSSLKQFKELVALYSTQKDILRVPMI